MRRFISSTMCGAAAVIAVALFAPRAAWSDTGPCTGLSGAAFGLCNAYCRALDCPGGHNGNSCASLRKNWQKLTHRRFLPCEPVCCECENGARACSTARRCAAATGCSIVDRCVDGQCPEVCPCGDTCTIDGVAGTCSPVAGAPDCRCVPGQPNPTPTATPTATEPPCPCGAECGDAAGAAGICRPTDPAKPDVCSCVTPEPTPTPTAPEANCPCGAPCTDTAGVVGTCRNTDPTTPDVCSCMPSEATPTPTVPACPCNAACTTLGGEVGICLPADGDVCVCVPNPSPCGQDPLTGQCGGACPAGETCAQCVTPPCPEPCMCSPSGGGVGLLTAPRGHH